MKRANLILSAVAALGFSLPALAMTDLSVSIDPSTLQQIREEIIAAKPGELPGKYALGQEKGTRLLIDSNFRVRTNLAVRNNLTGETAVPTFPLRLKFDELTDKYTAKGTFDMRVTGYGYYQNCRFPASIEIEAFDGGKSLDVVLKFPQQAALDTSLRCAHSVQTTSQGFGFNRVSE